MEAEPLVVAILVIGADVMNRKRAADRTTWATLLEEVGERETASSLAVWIEEGRPRFVPRRPDPVRRAAKDPRWRVLVKEKVEAET